MAENITTIHDFVTMVRNVRESQRRWPMHPVQASIETMALEQRLDEALKDGKIEMPMEFTKGPDGYVRTDDGAAGYKFDR